MRNPYIPYPSKILEVIRHTEKEFTFRMEYKGEEEVKPGQFFEVSVPKYGLGYRRGLRGSHHPQSGSRDERSL